MNTPIPSEKPFLNDSY